MEQECIRVLSFNLKRDFGIPLRKSRLWGNRRELAARLIRESGATIIGVQELLPQMREDVGKLLGDYSILGSGRFSGLRPKEDEHSDILVKKESATAQLVKTFWLSKSPERLSRAYYAAFPRICTVAEVRLSRLDRTIRVFNTHMDHLCGLARVLGVKVILDYMAQLNREQRLPTVLMGDFNAKPQSRPLRLLRQGLPDRGIHLTDVYSRLAPQYQYNTLHNFSGKYKANAKPIDYIFVSDEFEVVETQVVTTPVDGQFPSDHFPLEAVLRLKKEPVCAKRANG